MSERAGPPGLVGSRLLYLDNLKAVLVAGVIVAHAAMTYGATGSWILEVGDLGQPTVKGAPEALLSVAIGLGALFALGLFLLMAGMLTPASVRRKGPGKFALDRLLRLGIPIAAYVVVVWPLLGVLIDHTVGDTGRAPWSSYTHRLDRLDSGPMWFVAILLAFSLVSAVWARIAAPVSHSRSIPLRVRDLALAAVLIATGSFLARLAWPIDSHQILDLHLWLWPQCAVLFVFGVIGSDRGWFSPVSDHIRRACGIAAVGAVLVVPPILVVLGGNETMFKGGLHPQALLVDIFEGVFAVAMSLWLLAHFQRRHAGQGRVTAWLAPDAYGAYVAQAPVLVLIALALYPAAAPAGVKFLALGVSSVAASFAIAHAARALARRIQHPKSRPGLGRPVPPVAPRP